MGMWVYKEMLVAAPNQCNWNIVSSQDIKYNEIVCESSRVFMN